MPLAVQCLCRSPGVRDAIAEGVRRPAIKQRLREATEAAVELGVTGIPTVSVDGDLYWGDDRLQDAADALSAASRT